MKNSFTCPDCGMTSNNPSDAKYGFCGDCRAFTGDPALRPAGMAARALALGAPLVVVLYRGD